MSTTPLEETEDGFVGWIIDYAHAHGWLAAHFRPAKVREGKWVTPMQGDKGFPDLVLARRGRVVFIEAKREKGARVKPEQQRWLEELEPGLPSRAQHEAYVFRPHQREKIEELLR